MCLWTLTVEESCRLTEAGLASSSGEMREAGTKVKRGSRGREKERTHTFRYVHGYQLLVLSPREIQTSFPASFLPRIREKKKRSDLKERDLSLKGRNFWRFDGFLFGAGKIKLFVSERSRTSYPSPSSKSDIDAIAIRTSSSQTNWRSTRGYTSTDLDFFEECQRRLSEPANSAR